MAEVVDIGPDRTGGRVVDCSGLENLTGGLPKTSEMAGSCGLHPAPDALFAPCSAPSDGALVGTVG